jgi:hypothetical protein
MKALVYNGPGKRGWEEKPKPAIKNPTDAIIRITKNVMIREQKFLGLFSQINEKENNYVNHI